MAVAVHTEVPFQHALIGFETDDDDITADQRYEAVLLPGPTGMAYQPATA